MKENVFISRKIHKNAQELLSKHFNVKVWESEIPPTKKEIIENAHDCFGMISMLSDQINNELLEHLPQLKVVSNYAVGFNNINIEDCNQAGVLVSNTPDVLTGATADIALALLLNVSRNIQSSYQAIKQDQWQGWGPLDHLGMQLDGKTLGIIGMGRIGQDFARKCALCWNMRVIYFNRKEIPNDHLDFNATYAQLDEVLTQSDVISVHCPLTAQTKELFNREAFKKMKSHALFINTARGEVHNENDLYDALVNNEIAGAGLDVTNPEPMKSDSPLLNLNNVIITPHIGSATRETRGEMAKLCAENIIAAYEGKELLSGLN